MESALKDLCILTATPAGLQDFLIHHLFVSTMDPDYLSPFEDFVRELLVKIELESLDKDEMVHDNILELIGRCLCNLERMIAVFKEKIPDEPKASAWRGWDDKTPLDGGQEAYWAALQTVKVLEQFLDEKADKIGANVKPSETYPSAHVNGASNEGDVCSGSDIPTPKDSVRPIHSFTFKDFFRDPTKLNQVFTCLKANAYLENSTKANAFTSIFKGSPVKDPLVWCRNRNDLAYLINFLEGKGLIEPVANKWVITSECFVDSEGKKFDPMKLRKDTAPKDNRLKTLLEVLPI